MNVTKLNRIVASWFLFIQIWSRIRQLGGDAVQKEIQIVLKDKLLKCVYFSAD